MIRIAKRLAYLSGLDAFEEGGYVLAAAQTIQDRLAPDWRWQRSAPGKAQKRRDTPLKNNPIFLLIFANIVAQTSPKKLGISGAPEFEKNTRR